MRYINLRSEKSEPEKQATDFGGEKITNVFLLGCAGFQG